MALRAVAESGAGAGLLCAVAAGSSVPSFVAAEPSVVAVAAVAAFVAAFVVALIAAFDIAFPCRGLAPPCLAVMLRRDAVQTVAFAASLRFAMAGAGVVRRPRSRRLRHSGTTDAGRPSR